MASIFFTWNDPIGKAGVTLTDKSTDSQRSSQTKGRRVGKAWIRKKEGKKTVVIWTSGYMVYEIECSLDLLGTNQRQSARLECIGDNKMNNACEERSFLGWNYKTFKKDKMF